MLTAIYCRVSTKDKQSVRTQQQYLKDYAARESLEIYNVYSDVGESGSKDSRPQFDIMLRGMRDKKFKAILVYKLDRIGRSLSHLVKLFEEFSKRDIHFISATQNINTSTAEGEMFRNMLMVFADYERKLTVSRIKDGLERARKEGKPIGKRGKDKKRRRVSGYHLRWGKKTTPK